MAKTVCNTNMCTACMACVDICPKSAIVIKDSLKHENAIIDETKCIACGMCEKVCQIVKPLPLKESIKWFQGWNNAPAERQKSSSGAFAYGLAKQVINEGGYVAACRFEKGEFRYSIAKDVDELTLFRESKYVKSNPIGIFKSVKKLLVQGLFVLFIGLPCHVAAMKKYLGRDYGNLITVDLICHGSPSPKLLELFLQQYEISLETIKSIHFRQKGSFRLTGENVSKNTERKEISFTQPGIRDRYSIAFLYGLIYTENCYYCPYARIDRVSDITIGDSWGSEIGEEEMDKGVSLALCQTEKGINLVERSPLKLFDVNLDKAMDANHQLREPYPIPKNRDNFFRAIEKNISFNNAVKKSFPRACFRLDVKDFLFKTGLLKIRGGVIDSCIYRITIEE